MLLPALQQARAKSRGISCVSRHKQLGLAAVMYVNDNRDTVMSRIIASDSYMLPNGKECTLGWILWQTVLYPYVNSYMPFNCTTPTCKQGSAKEYAYEYDGGYRQYPSIGLNRNVAGKARGLFAHPSHTCFFGDVQTAISVDSSDGWNSYCFPLREMLILHGRHNDSPTICYADGHAASRKSSSIPFRSESSKFWCPAPVGTITD